MITQSRLKEVLDYNPETGMFVWKLSRGRNARLGENAGSMRCDGYIAIKIDGKSYKAHRLAWLFIYGYLPKNDTDHRDHDRSNNRINNLRDVTRSENQENQIKARTNNVSTRLLGVYFRDDYSINKYVAKIRISGKLTPLGCFSTAESAHAAYVAAKRIHHGTCTL